MGQRRREKGEGIPSASLPRPPPRRVSPSWRRRRRAERGWWCWVGRGQGDGVGVEEEEEGVGSGPAMKMQGAVSGILRYVLNMLPQPLCPTSSHMSLQKPQRLPSKGDLGLVTQPQKQMAGRAALALTATPTDWKGARFVCCLPRSPGHKCPTVVPAMFPGSRGSCMASDSPTVSPGGLGTKLPPALPTLGLCMPWVAGNVARWHTGLTWDLTRGRKPSRRDCGSPSFSGGCPAASSYLEVGACLGGAVQGP